MAVLLRIRGGKHDGQEIRINQKKKYLIGRGDDCDLRVASDKVSRYHCAMTIDEPCVVLRDMGSSNGTFVNRKKISSPYELVTGDLVTVGALDFEVIIVSLKPTQSQCHVLDEDAAQWVGDAGTKVSSTDDTNILTSQEFAALQLDLAGPAPRVTPPTARNTRSAAEDAIRKMNAARATRKETN